MYVYTEEQHKLIQSMLNIHNNRAWLAELEGYASPEEIQHYSDTLEERMMVSEAVDPQVKDAEWAKRVTELQEEMAELEETCESKLEAAARQVEALAKSLQEQVKLREDYERRMHKAEGAVEGYKEQAALHRRTQDREEESQKHIATLKQEMQAQTAAMREMEEELHLHRGGANASARYFGEEELSCNMWSILDNRLLHLLPAEDLEEIERLKGIYQSDEWLNNCTFIEMIRVIEFLNVTQWKLSELEAAGEAHVKKCATVQSVIAETYAEIAKDASDIEGDKLVEMLKRRKEHTADGYLEALTPKELEEVYEYWLVLRDQVMQEQIADKHKKDTDNNELFKGLNPLEVLGLQEGYSMKELKGAYRKAASANHPDKHGGNDDKMKVINWAKSEAERLLGAGQQQVGGAEEAEQHTTPSHGEVDGFEDFETSEDEMDAVFSTATPAPDVHEAKWAPLFKEIEFAVNNPFYDTTAEQVAWMQKHRVMMSTDELMVMITSKDYARAEAIQSSTPAKKPTPIPTADDLPSSDEDCPW